MAQFLLSNKLELGLCETQVKHLQKHGKQVCALTTKCSFPVNLFIKISATETFSCRDAELSSEPADSATAQMTDTCVVAIIDLF